MSYCRCRFHQAAMFLFEEYVKIQGLYPCLFIPVPTAEDKAKEERRKSIQAERRKSIQIEKEKKEEAKQQREKEKLAKIAEQAK